jgi:hypothetical protein
MQKQSKNSNRGGARPGAGRPKGSLDKGNAMIREMIVDALDGVGGVEYLQETARSHPAAFLSLIGKVMPVQIAGDEDNPLRHVHKVELVGVGPSQAS